MKYTELMNEKINIRVGEKLAKGEKKVWGIMDGKKFELNWNTKGDNEEWKKKAVAEYQKQLKSGKIKESTIDEALKNKVDISKIKDDIGLIGDIDKAGKEGTDYKLSGTILSYSDKLKKVVAKYVKESIKNTFSKFMDEGKQQGFKVTLKGKVIDTVFYDKGMSPEEVKKSLIDHDNYDPSIKVTKEAIKYEFYDAFADTMASYMKMKKDVVLKWLKKHYPKEGDVVNVVSKQMGKDFKVVVDAILKDKKLNEDVSHETNTTFSKFMNEEKYKNVKEYEKEILNYMKSKKDYIKIDDIGTDLLVPKSSKETSFDVAYKNLVKKGNLELLGNSIKIKESTEGENKMKNFTTFMNENTVLEQEGDVNVDNIIKELIDTGWSGDNKSQMKAIQLLKGLATSDNPKANDFMKKLDDFTSGMKSE